MPKKLIGKLTHYFDKIGVGVIELSGTLNKGDKISIEHSGEAFEQTVESMQIEHKQIAKAIKGQAIGMKMAQPAKHNSSVFKVTD